MPERYPGYDVLGKWNSPSFDAVTREVLARRLGAVPKRRFFTRGEWELLEALGAHLIPQSKRADPIPITPWIDAMLADGGGEGFHRVGEPRDAEVWRTGLAAIDGEARRRHQARFIDLGPPMREALLRDLRAGAAGDGWSGVGPRRFLIDFLLKAMAAIYYSHPAAWSEIGFGGPASPRGYVRLQLGRRDPWEAGEAK
ncbi:MAG: gluconate 2-dehydrogenase subunit 3 family protein [Caulobacteraceae bacterium]|nr:gluconate 2-dehydrogenase subunit 3 family protein [Caulobacteraceae bacterium]